ncbi:hypothetical protein RHABOEDO_000291 [Candidatus Rhabdochlamydia oedothoracis]|uniref:Uncharacterized protein n=1 Tax=Candidatus Rhabdochlamydia oedothoracis TaxID=2720720 RepID=A0ABX8UYZ0_9BACT|nr:MULTISPECIES: hypothetical protein [Rhabdochlamydia]KAG6559631.1 hypothetical protein RHOW815_000347 [Candidatus Rhabdochlamydia sp. W815]MCL6756476.1 hypothetical protein [Candidatus Rhabdochlamydia oedothoracis]QYF48180.1 hypothetical protein RHABOEDO_000291 [Candidatus Rhabdochlamydia oedothoracis]
MFKFFCIFLINGSIVFSCLQEESPDASLITEYVEDIMISIDKTVEEIIAIPSYQQTFENTIKPCVVLTEDLFHAFMLLYTLREERTLQTVVDWELKKLNSFLKTEVFDNPKFQQSLLIYLATMLDENGTLNAYKRCLI